MKKSILSNVSEFIAKLEKLNFTSVDGKDLITEDGYKLSYYVSESTLIGNREDCAFVGLPVNIYFQVRRNGVKVAGWGCAELEDTTELMKWYVLKKSDVQNAEFKAESKQKAIEELIWGNL